MTKLFFDQPIKADKEGWNSELIGRSTTDYEPKKAAGQLYNYISRELPYLTFIELSNIIIERHQR